MDLIDRLQSVEKRFNELETNRQKIASEQERLRGEYRILEELIAEQEKVKKSAVKPNVKVKGE